MAINITPAKRPDVGDIRLLKATFRDANKVPVGVLNLGDIIVTVRDPDGTESTFTGGQLTNEGSGVVSVEVRFTKGRRWYVRWDWNDGSDGESEEAFINVKVPQVTPSSKAVPPPPP